MRCLAVPRNGEHAGRLSDAECRVQASTDDRRPVETLARARGGLRRLTCSFLSGLPIEWLLNRQAPPLSKQLATDAGHMYGRITGVTRPGGATADMRLDSKLDTVAKLFHCETRKTPLTPKTWADAANAAAMREVVEHYASEQESLRLTRRNLPIHRPYTGLPPRVCRGC